jgi:hypothetical protein
MCSQDCLGEVHKSLIEIGCLMELLMGMVTGAAGCFSFMLHFSNLCYSHRIWFWNLQLKDTSWRILHIGNIRTFLIFMCIQFSCDLLPYRQRLFPFLLLLGLLALFICTSTQIIFVIGYLIQIKLSLTKSKYGWNYLDVYYSKWWYNWYLFKK